MVIRLISRVMQEERGGPVKWRDGGQALHSLLTEILTCRCKRIINVYNSRIFSGKFNETGDSKNQCNVFFLFLFFRDLSFKINDVWFMAVTTTCRGTFLFEVSVLIVASFISDGDGKWWVPLNHRLFSPWS